MVETSEKIPAKLGPEAAEGGHVAAFCHVLVCLDGSPAAEGALPLAMRLARLDGARMTLVRVLDAPARGPEIRATDAIAWEVARGQARSYLRKLAAPLEAEGTIVDQRVAEGSAAHEIRSLAATTATDLIVFSTHGEGGDSAWELGSTARKVLDLAGSALLVVPSYPRRASPVLPPLRRIFVPLDGSLRGESALPTALRLARAEGAEVILAHVVAEPIRTEMLYTDSDLALAGELADRLATRADAYLEQVRSRIGAASPGVRKAVARAAGQRAGLVSLATSMEADLIVLTAHGSVCDTRRRFGSVTWYFIAHSTVPVLVLPDVRDTGRSPTAGTSRPPPRSVDAEPG